MAKKKGRRRHRPTRTAARSALKDGLRSTLGLPLEERLVVVAQGIDFHNRQLPREWRIPDCLIDDASNPFDDLKIPGIVKVSATEATYTNQAQKVRYTVRTTQDKKEFHGYLEGRLGKSFGNNVLLIYAGHARYGRGPCLGKTDAPGNHWGTGDDPSAEGIFRMGYPYLYVPCTEIISHGYKASVARSQTSDPGLAAVNIRRVSRSTHIHPHLRPYLKRSRTKGYSLAELDAMVKRFQDDVANAVAQVPLMKGVPPADFNPHDSLGKVLRHHKNGQQSLKPHIMGQTGAGERFWATYKYKKLNAWWKATDGSYQSQKLRNPRRRSGNFRWPEIILWADWRNTVSGSMRASPASPPARMDLGSTKLASRGFCHFGCSTFQHNYRVMRFMKKWKRSKDRHDRLCYWTTAAAKMDVGHYWIYHTLTYIPGRYRGYKSRKWGDVQRYARSRTNTDLALDRRPYRIK